MTNAFELTITLRVAEPHIWRRLVVLKDHSLHELHAIFQGAMGWSDCHAHRFQIGNLVYENDDEGLSDEAIDGRKTRLRDIFAANEIAEYLYDFGDGWRHDVIFQKEMNHPMHWPYAICIDGGGACPPEDCGGSEGFSRLLSEISDPAHPNYVEAMNWSNGFQPMVFSKSQANVLIGATAAIYRERGLGFSEGTSILGGMVR